MSRKWSFSDFIYGMIWLERMIAMYFLLYFLLSDLLILILELVAVVNVLVAVEE